MRLTYERKFWRRGFEFLAGVDEAGRGPLAGPVVAAAVIFTAQTRIPGLDDSKKLSPRKREALLSQIKKQALAFSYASISHQTIDRINILQATLLAMKLAVEKLSISPDHLLIDGKMNQLDLIIPQLGINGGDGKCASIAAASIVAKVMRDRMMFRYHEKYPRYNFHRHKGYGTRDHLKKLRQFGPCPLHRRSFSPVS